jgi:hypothetical protein
MNFLKALGPLRGSISNNTITLFCLVVCFWKQRCKSFRFSRVCGTWTIQYQGIQYFSSQLHNLQVVLFVYIWKILMNIFIQRSLKSGGTIDHFRWVKIPGPPPLIERPGLGLFSILIKLWFGCTQVGQSLTWKHLISLIELDVISHIYYMHTIDMKILDWLI